MNIESATGTFVFTFDFEKYVKENRFRTLHDFFLIMHFYGKCYLIDPQYWPPIWGDLLNKNFHKNDHIIINLEN